MARLNRLRIRGFRNLGEQELEVPPPGFALVGDNAQGKSNLLEAIYYLETFRSFRGAKDRELVAFGETVFRLEGCVSDERSGGSRVSAAYRRDHRVKKVTVDGQEAKRIGGALGRLGAVVFSPMDLGLVKGGPAERRRFLDIVLSLNDPDYLQHLQRFRQCLDRRNAALKGGGGVGSVASWDGLLARHGGEVAYRRRRWVSRFRETFEEYYRRVSGGLGAWMDYRSTSDPQSDVGSEGDVRGTDSAETVSRYARALASSLEEDRRRGWTSTGPQRDDLYITIEVGGRPRSLRDFGSGGQLRTGALALRLTEGDTIRETKGEVPIILLDDVFAELDPGRSQRLLELLDSAAVGQVLLTAPKEADVRLRRDSLPRWRIRDGRVEG